MVHVGMVVYPHAAKVAAVNARIAYFEPAGRMVPRPQPNTGPPMNARYATLLAGAFTLYAGSLMAQPANDACATALPLTVNPSGSCPGAAITATTLDATNAGGAALCENGPLQDVWYTFTTTGFANPFQLDLAGIGAGHWAAELYIGSCGGQLFACYPESPTLIVFNDLEPGQTYFLRLFSNTDLGAAGAVSLCLSATEVISWCGANIYDAGGPTGNYPGGLLPYTATFVYCPDQPGQYLNIAFTQFNTLGGDILRIFDGPDNTFPLLAELQGNLNTNLPGPFNSTHPSGCLTFRFSYGGFFITAPGWAAVSTCCEAPVISVAPTSNGPVCLGGELQLFANSNVGTSFTWTGPGGFTSTDENPVLPVFTGANIGTYSVVANAGTPGCSSNAASVTVGSIQPPPVVNALASETQLCLTGTVDLVADVPTTIVGLQQGFETWPAPGFGLGGSGVAANQNSTYFIEGTRSLLLSHNFDANGNYAMTSSIDLTSLPSPRLSFWHICALEQGWDYGFVEYSLNGGGSWTQLPAASYLGTGNSNFNPNARFSRNSYAAWQAQFNNSSATPGPGPATDLWRQEEFDLAAFATSTNFRIRFRITSDGSINYFGWLIDDIRITGQIPSVDVVWSSDPIGLSSTELEVIDVAITGTTTFTVTAFSAPGCGTEASVTVELIGAQVSIEGAPDLTVCAGEPFDLVGSATGGEPPLVYVWYGGDFLLGTTPTVEDVTLQVSTTVTLPVFDGSGCDNQAVLEVEVLPLPTVTLSALGQVCVNAAPFALSGGLPAGGTYLVDGVATTTFDPAAAGPGTYAITYVFTDADGCSNEATTSLLVDPCAGIDELDGSRIALFPNPATDLLYVRADVGRHQLRILDAAGRAVWAEEGRMGNDREEAISLAGLSNGAYTVELITAAGQRWATRLVVAR